MADLNETMALCEAWRDRDNRFRYEDEFNQAVATAEKLAEWMLANCPALERMELERAARAYFNVNQETPVRVLPTGDFPDLVTIHYEDSDCRMVEVGADWKPKVTP